MTIEALGFDLDGTLIDSTDAIVECMQFAFEATGQMPPDRAAVVGTISVPLGLQLSQLGAKCIDECIAVYRERYALVAPEKTFLIGGVREGLETLREADIRMSVATSKSRPAAQQLLDHLDIAKFFEFCLGPEDVAEPKPHPDAVRQAVARLGATGATGAYVGDSTLDVRASRAAGIPCYCVTTGYATREALEAHAPAGIFNALPPLVRHILDAASS